MVCKGLKTEGKSEFRLEQYTTFGGCPEASHFLLFNAPDCQTHHAFSFHRDARTW